MAPATKISARKALAKTKLDLESEAPLHGQIRTAIEKMIASGKFTSGSVLPGEQELAAHFDVSRITVKRALNDLALAGQVRRMRGRGTIVTGGATHPLVRGSFSTLFDSLRAMGMQTDVELLSVEKHTPAKEVADALELGKTAKVQRAIRLRHLEGSPFSYLITYVPLDIAAHYEDEALATTPLLTLIEETGVKITEAEQSLTAIAATKEIADQLHIAVGSPILKIFRIMKDQSSRPVQAIEAHYRPDRFQYHMRLNRRKSGGADIWSGA
ncbi:MAG: GntR family transcriptional regulator [Pseudomonadota bacterium]